jgi:hypothetical protein
MTGPTGYPPPPPPAERVELGGRTVELAPDDAATVRQAFTDLAQAYGTSLDEQRRQLLSSLGTPQWHAPPIPAPAAPSTVAIPDPDLLFANKDAWAGNLGQALEGRFAQERMAHAALVQHAVAAVDQELQRRDLRTQAQTVHDQTMEEMLERRKLGDHRRIVQTIYNEQYGNLQHLPLGMAIDQIGQLAQDEIATIRGEHPAGHTAESEPAAAQTGPPAMLRSARRAGASAAPAGGGHQPKTISDLIRHRQAVLLGHTAA